MTIAYLASGRLATLEQPSLTRPGLYTPPAQTANLERLLGIGGGWALEVLMLPVGGTGSLGQAAGCVWARGGPFYGTRVGPGRDMKLQSSLLTD
jgi:hypothetical protein